MQGWTGLGDNWNTDPLTHLVMHTCYLVQLDQPARRFSSLARKAQGAARTLDTDNPTHASLRNALDDAFKLLDTPSCLARPFMPACRRRRLPWRLVLPVLARRSMCAWQPLATHTLMLPGCGRWSKPGAKRRRKFHTVLRLSEQFPAYYFTQSQPQLNEFVRQDYPELFAALRKRIAEGRWEPIGGMWVEADCNLSGAESLAHQFMLGRAYFPRYFGAQAESPVLWLPVVFGYAWSLSQLIKQAGLEYFFTIKLGWNQNNRIPYDSFWWQGLDGTRALTHFGTTPENSSTSIATYNALATPEAALNSWKNFQQKDHHADVFMSFGYGDGSGGENPQSRCAYGHPAGRCGD